MNRSIRIATWNVGQRTRTSHGQLDSARYLREDLHADLALLQEAKPHPDWPQLVMPYRAIDANRPWASAIASWGPTLHERRTAKGRESKTDVDLLRTFPGSLAAADVEMLDGERITLISLYGLMDAGYAYTTLHKQLSDLSYLLDSREGKRVIVGGDFNAATQSKRARWRALYRNLWERFELLRLVDVIAATRSSRPLLPDCNCASTECGHVTTLNLRSGAAIQADWFFATPAVMDRVLACRVVDGTTERDPFELSDHRPILLDIAL